MLGLGLSLTGGSGGGSGGGPALDPIIPYVLLDSFDTLGSRTVTSGAAQEIVAPLVEGTGALRVSETGVQNVTTTNPNIGVDEAPTAWDLMAVAVNLGDNPHDQCVVSVRPTITTNSVGFAYQVDSGAGTVQPVFADHTSRGVRWRSFAASRLRQTNFAGAQLPSTGSGTKSVAMQAQQGNNGDWASRPVFDALIRPTRHKPCIMITADDVNTRQRSEMAGLLQSRGLVATGYAAMGLFGTSGKLTLAEAVELRDTFGWAWCLNSGSLDEPLLGFPTVAAAVTALNSHRDAFVASGLGPAANAKHISYSYGSIAYRAVHYAVSATCNGTATVTLGGANAWNNQVSTGMVVKGTTLGTDPVVVDAPTQGTVVLSAAVPSGTRTLTFCGNSLGIATTCNGTTTVNCNTTGIVPGQLMTGRDVPANTTVVSVDVESASGTITVSNAVPSTCTRAGFYLTSGEFYGGKLNDALMASGYLTGRRVTVVGGVYTGYGLDPRLAINFPGYSLDSTTYTATRAVADIQAAIDDATDLLCYQHFATAHDAAHSVTVLDFIEARVAAGDCDVVTVPQWWDRVAKRAPFA